MDWINKDLLSEISLNLASDELRNLFFAFPSLINRKVFEDRLIVEQRIFDSFISQFKIAEDNLVREDSVFFYLAYRIDEYPFLFYDFEFDGEFWYCCKLNPKVVQRMIIEVYPYYRQCISEGRDYPNLDIYSYDNVGIDYCLSNIDELEQISILTILNLQSRNTVFGSINKDLLSEISKYLASDELRNLFFAFPSLINQKVFESCVDKEYSIFDNFLDQFKKQKREYSIFYYLMDNAQNHPFIFSELEFPEGDIWSCRINPKFIKRMIIEIYPYYYDYCSRGKGYPDLAIGSDDDYDQVYVVGNLSELEEISIFTRLDLGLSTYPRRITYDLLEIISRGRFEEYYSKYKEYILDYSNYTTIEEFNNKVTTILVLFNYLPVEDKAILLKQMHTENCKTGSIYSYLRHLVK